MICLNFTEAKRTSKQIFRFFGKVLNFSPGARLDRFLGLTSPLEEFVISLSGVLLLELIYKLNNTMKKIKVMK